LNFLTRSEEKKKVEKKILEKILSARGLFLLTHENPDIDGLSCMLSFYLLFEEKRPIPIVEEIPSKAQYLHGAESLRICDGEIDLPEGALIILFDAGSEDRISSKIRSKIINPSGVIVFDHHRLEETANLFGVSTEFYLDPEEASCSSLFYRFLKACGIPLTKEVAENLLAGIYYDTGSFRHDNVKGKIFGIAQELLDLGARPSYITSWLYENTPRVQLEYLRLTLERLKFLKNGEVAISYLTWEDFERLGGERWLNDLAGFLRSIEGVKYGIIVKEVEKGKIKVSLRSKAPWEILSLAREFGGGGHKYACGFKINGVSLQDFLNLFERRLEDLL